MTDWLTGWLADWLTDWLNGTWRFITLFTGACHWSLSLSRCIQSTNSYPVSPRSILILSYHLHLGFLSGLFPSAFPVTIFHALFISPMHAACPALANIMTNYTYRTWSAEMDWLMQSPLWLFFNKPKGWRCAERPKLKLSNGVENLGWIFWLKAEGKYVHRAVAERT